ATAFNRAVDLIEERRDALHLIEHDDPIGLERPQLQPEQCGVGRQRLIPALVEQVDDVGIGEGLQGPRALTNAAHAIQEEASPGRGENPSVSALCHYVVIIPCKMTAWLQLTLRAPRGIESSNEVDLGD